jgi:hypothetical protein
MDKPERLHRQDPERDGPNRSALSFMRDTATVGRANAKAQTNGSDPGEDVLAHGINLGYSVIDDQIRRGERLAERLRHGAATPGVSPTVELSQLLERALNVYKDMGALAVTAAEALARSPMLQAGLSRAWPGNGVVEPGRAPGAGSRFSIELASSRKTHIEVDLRQTVGTGVPLVHALHAVNPAHPPLTGAHFTLEPGATSPLLHISVPDAQPAATYSGVIVDGGTNQPCGTISLRILP